MSTTFEEVCLFINDAGMDILTDVDNNNETRVCYYLTLLGTSFKIYIDLQDNGRLVQIYAYPRNHRVAGVSHEALDLVHELLNDFNKDIRYGRWSIDSDGDARVHFSLFIEDAPFTRRQLARIHFLLSDLMIYQAQMLHIQAKLDYRISSRLFGLNAVAVQSVIDYPSEIDVILQAIHATEPQAHLLHDVIGKIFVTAETVTEPTDEEPDDNDASDSGDRNSRGEGQGGSSQAASELQETNTRPRARRASILH